MMISGRLTRRRGWTKVCSGGIRVPTDASGATDVMFDGRVVWSFDPEKDGIPEPFGRRIPWPALLARRLDGVTEVALHQHDTGDEWFRREVRFGSSSERLELVDPHGHPLAISKTGRLETTWSQGSATARNAVLDATAKALDDLRDLAGLEAFLSGGCLLGAVRDGRLIAHDTDTDIAYLSGHDHPFDVIRESRRAEREMRRRGWDTVRMSAADFKVWADLGNGRSCGIDVFASFHIGDTYNLVPFARGDVDHSDVVPLTTVTLEGQQFPAPGNVERYLEFIYGPGWREPDPSYRHQPPVNVVRRFDSWLRGVRDQRRHWFEFYEYGVAGRVPNTPSHFARWVDEQVGPRQHIIDVGAGNGRDSVWFAQRGHRVIATDFVVPALRMIRRRAANGGANVPARMLNLNETRTTLLAGARLAHSSGRTHLYGRLLLDALSIETRARFWRFASIAQRGGGRTFLEFRTSRSAGESTYFPPHRRTYADPDHVAAEVSTHGGTVIDRVVGRDLAPLGSENPEICRMTVRWTR